MSEDTLVLLALVGMVWIGWPLHTIADHLGALRKRAGA